MERVYKTDMTVYAFPMWTALKIIALLGLCYAAVAARIYFSQHKMLYFPKREVSATPADIDLAFDDVWLTNRLGTRVHGWWLPHDTPRFTVLFSHGNGGNLSHRLDTLRIFHELGLSVLAYDYSGYGQSDGKPDEDATGADARAAWDWLIEEHKAAPGTIVLFGRSLGGAVTAELANELAASGTLPAGIIMESTFTSVPDMGAYLYPWLPVRQLSRYEYDSLSALSNIHLPGLFMHSPDDDIVPYDIGRKLHAAYQGPKTFLTLSGDHNSGFLTSGEVYTLGLDRFLTSLQEGTEQ